MLKSTFTVKNCFLFFCFFFFWLAFFCSMLTLSSSLLRSKFHQGSALRLFSVDSDQP